MVRNSLYMMATTVATSGLGYVYWGVAARLFSSAQVGLAAALVSAMTLTSIASSFGVHSVLVHQLPRLLPGRPWSSLVNGVLLIGTVTGTLAGIAAGVVLPLFYPDARDFLFHSTGFALFVVGAPLWTISLTVDYIFIAERAAGFTFERNALHAILKIALLFAGYAASFGGGYAILASWIAATGATCIYSLWLRVPRLLRGYGPFFAQSQRHVKGLAGMLLSNHIINLGNWAPMYLLPVFVAVRLSSAENAYFYITWMMSTVLFIVSRSVSASLFAEGVHTPTELRLRVISSVKLIAALLAPGIAGFVLFGRMVQGVFGPNYAYEAGGLLLILTASTIPDAITNIYVSVLRVQLRLRAAAALNGGMALVALAGAWFLLPTLGLNGAGWAWLGAEVMGSVLVVAHVGAYLHRRDWRTQAVAAEDSLHSHPHRSG